jgi:hypothetical protein
MQSFTSANTSINSKKAPAIYSMPKAIELMKGKKVIDIGGGRYDTAVLKAAEYGAMVSIYDPYNRTADHNDIVLKDKYDVAVISNVLNVISDLDSRLRVLSLALSRAHMVLITVYEGDRTGIGRQTGIDSWQENRKLNDYYENIKSFLPNTKKCGKMIIIKRNSN